MLYMYGEPIVDEITASIMLERWMKAVAWQAEVFANPAACGAERDQAAFEANHLF